MIWEESSLDGILIGIDGIDDKARLKLQHGFKKYSSIEIDRVQAKAIAGHLYEYVRVLGRGRWSRDNSGAWHMKKFIVTSFEVLRDVSLLESVAELRALKGMRP